MKKILLFISLITANIAAAQVAIGAGTGVDTNAGLSTPISIFYSTSLSQSIYLASEIGSAGTITSIDFKLNQTGTLTNTNAMIDVWVGHSNISSYSPVVGTSGADWIDISTHSQVLANGSFSVDGTILTCTFSTPFEYNGTDNLVITVDANQPGNNGSTIKFLQTAVTTDVTSLMIRTDNAAHNADPFNPPLNYTGTTTATSVQAKKTRPQVVLNGTFLGTDGFTINSVALYPNPVKNNIFIESKENVAAGTIYNIAGQLIRKVVFTDNKVSVDDLAAGMYVLKLQFENGNTATKKFTKQ